MNHDPVILNAGLAMAMEFGEHWLARVQDRLGALYPTLNARELDGIDRLCRAVMQYGNTRVTAHLVPGGDHAAASAAFTLDLRERYPWISDANLSRLFSQACYYAWKDGFPF